MEQTESSRMDTSSAEVNKSGNDEEKEASLKTKQKGRGKKRKRKPSSDSSSSSELPDNCLEVEQNLQATAAKNNLSDESVKKILKKVVTNDHVLALVKLREEEESSSPEEEVKPKLTRAKAKNMTRVSPTHHAPWNLELTPIKQIPVKTRPEVTALIDQDLPDESDEEYQMTHDDVPSDDDQTLESCSDLESQPRTPASCSQQPSSSPIVSGKDGPFKVPVEIKTPGKKRIQTEEDATIALRTRSKLCLSSTSIEHIESSFVPPDEPPLPAVDDLWSQFLNECLDPALTLRHEDDDEADPEYNVATDQDASDEDEESLENSIVKISQKELNDLVNELFQVTTFTPPEPLPIPETEAGSRVMGLRSGKDVLMTPGKQEPGVMPEAGNAGGLVISEIWSGKQEPMTEGEEIECSQPQQSNVLAEKDLESPFTGKRETEMSEESKIHIVEHDVQDGVLDKEMSLPEPAVAVPRQSPTISVQVQENRVIPEAHETPPPILRDSLTQPTQNRCIQIRLESHNGKEIILPEQISILQQQLRIHIQLATSNYLQLYAHPLHWSMAPVHREYLLSLEKILNAKPESVVNVCNLRPAVELCQSWESCLSEKTNENAEMVEFLEKEVTKSRRRNHRNTLHIGDFHPTFQQVVASSSVFLYPYLLPPVPWRCNLGRRLSYLRSEDELIALGLEQFFKYIAANPDLYVRECRRITAGIYHGLASAIELLVKHMFPWITSRTMHCHINHVRKVGDLDNPIRKFFKTRQVEPVRHVLMSYNPNITLHEHPEHEMPLIWLRYLSSLNKRAKLFLQRRVKISGLQPSGVEIDFSKVLEPNQAVLPPTKKPLPVESPKISLKIAIRAAQKSSDDGKSKDQMGSISLIPMGLQTAEKGSSDKSAKSTDAFNNYSLVQTPLGAYLIPVTIMQQKIQQHCPTAQNVTSNDTESTVVIVPNNLPEECCDDRANVSHMPESCKGGIPGHIVTVSSNSPSSDGHCNCCSILRKITKNRQSVITEFFSLPGQGKKPMRTCLCLSKETSPKISSRLQYLLGNVKVFSFSVWRELHTKIHDLQSKIVPLDQSLLQSMLSVNMTNEGMVRALEFKDGYVKDANKFSDMAYVMAFLVKMNTKMSLSPVRYLKFKVFRLLSQFNTHTDDATKLFFNLRKAFGDEMADFSMEFLNFLTPEQADKIHRFRDYFVQNYLSPLMQKIEEYVPDERAACRILVALSSELKQSRASACQICSRLLPYMERHEKLAHYLYSLFPHSIEQSEIPRPAESQSSSADKCASVSNEEPPSTRERSPSQCSHEADDSPVEAPEAGREKRNSRNYEADDSSTGEESGCDNPPSLQPAPSLTGEDKAKDAKENDTSSTTQDKPVENAISAQDHIVEGLNVNMGKTNVPDLLDTSDTTMAIVSEDESVKLEVAEWTRDEDKMILELLKETVTPEERKDKTILEILEEKRVFEILSDSLLHKSFVEIRDRILYLLELLAFND